MSMASTITTFFASKTGVLVVVVLASIAITLSVFGAFRSSQRQHCIEKWANDTVHRAQALSKAEKARADTTAVFDEQLIILLSDIKPTSSDPAVAKAQQAKFLTDLQATQKAGLDFTAADASYRTIAAARPVVVVDLHC